MSSFAALTIFDLAVGRTMLEKGADYLARPTGSSVDGLDVASGAAVGGFLSGQDWQEVTEEAEALGVRLGSCRYFRATIGDGHLEKGYMGQEGICLLSEVSDADLANVRIVRGHHGNLEIQLAGQSPRPTTTIHIILGNFESWPNGEVTEETARVVTWYPGRLTAPVGLDRATVKFTR